MSFEMDIIRWLQSGRTESLDLFQKIFSYSASIFAVIIVAVLFFFLYNKRFALLFVITECFSYGIGFILKKIIARPRPYMVAESGIFGIMEESSFSMPSGHSLCAMIIALFLIMMIIKVCKTKTGKGFAISGVVCYLIMIAINRMYLGVHYLSDILLGFAISAIIFTICWLVEPKIYNVIEKKFLKNKEVTTDEQKN
ncbi:MAG: phosphatase PAP2 family protein [Clostridia bacterium]